MENTLLQGDHIIINKFQYGARFPITILSIPFTDNYNIHAYLDWIQMPYFRLPGFGKIKNNDIIVFNNPVENDPPVDKKTIFVKRCIGVPGDTIRIIDKIIYVNNNIFTDAPLTKYKFRIVTDSGEISPKIIKKYKLKNIKTISSKGVFDVMLTKIQADSLLKEQSIDTVRIMKSRAGYDCLYIFPHDYSYIWNADYFGPLIIPAKGTTMPITVKNLPLYRRILDVYENNTVSLSNDKVYINGNYCTKYKFKKNYYFVMDDNRDRARDSRHWGFVPEDHIIGSAWFIWYSAGIFMGINSPQKYQINLNIIKLQLLRS